MKAIVVTDQNAGLTGMKLVEMPEPSAAINDVVVQTYAASITGDELSWPSTWVDRAGAERTPSIPVMSWPELSQPLGMALPDCQWDNGFSGSRTGIEMVRWQNMWLSRRATLRHYRTISISMMVLRS